MTLEFVCPWQAVREHASAWRDATPAVWSIVADGARLEWGDEGPPGPFRLPSHAVPEQYLDLVARELDRMVAIGMVEEVEVGSSDYCSPASVVVKIKPNGTVKIRIVVDLRHLNEHLVERRFRQEGLREVAQLIQPNDLLGSIDIRDAFCHVGIHAEDQRYLGFSLAGREFVGASALFGCKHSPILWYKLMGKIMEELRDTHGIRCTVYVDDLLWFAETPEEYVRIRQCILDVLAKHGVQVSWDKVSGPVGETRIKYLGLMVDATAPEPAFEVPEEVRQDIRARATRLLDESGRGQRRVPARFIKSFAGKVQSVDRAVRECRLYSRELHNVVGQSYGWRKVALSPQAVADLEWWAALEPASCRRPIRAAELSATVQLWTDASKVAWGAVLYGQEIGADWLLKQRKWSINRLEVAAVVNALSSFGEELRGHTVLLLADNMTVVHAVRSGTSRVPKIMKLLRRVHELCAALDVTLVTRYVNTKVNRADAASRSRKFSALDWRLDEQVFADIQRRFGVQCSVDVFASANAHLCDRFVSRIPNPGAWLVDAFSFPWGSECVFANPPFALVGKALVHARETLSPGGSLVIVVPEWRGKWWWPLLNKMACEWCEIDRAAILPPPTWSSRVEFQAEPLKNERWKLWACLVRC